MANGLLERLLAGGGDVAAGSATAKGLREPAGEAPLASTGAGAANGLLGGAAGGTAPSSQASLSSLSSLSSLCTSEGREGEGGIRQGLAAPSGPSQAYLGTASATVLGTTARAKNWRGGGTGVYGSGGEGVWLRDTAGPVNGLAAPGASESCC